MIDHAKVPNRTAVFFGPVIFIACVFISKRTSPRPAGLAIAV
jgi:hypothetical protein